MRCGHVQRWANQLLHPISLHIRVGTASPLAFGAGCRTRTCEGRRPIGVTARRRLPLCQPSMSAGLPNRTVTRLPREHAVPTWPAALASPEGLRHTSRNASTGESEAASRQAVAISARSQPHHGTRKPAAPSGRAGRLIVSGHSAPLTQGILNRNHRTRQGISGAAPQRRHPPLHDRPVLLARVAALAHVHDVPNAVTAAARYRHDMLLLCRLHR